MSLREYLTSWTEIARFCFLGFGSSPLGCQEKGFTDIHSDWHLPVVWGNENSFRSSSSFLCAIRMNSMSLNSDLLGPGTPFLMGSKSGLFGDNIEIESLKGARNHCFFYCRSLNSAVFIKLPQNQVLLVKGVNMLNRNCSSAL